ncbi:MAG: type II toxin-antitoxin system VapC family toxin [Phycisphaeraceae bacterium]|nr:type II toxin-antitoxin system VapC family toxin [Phycisphaeraceae bacterium]MCW5768381.1 type II toxin-antitoxin system VapC family toxin [Phycisphaeraceae bacterium]
MSRLLIDTDVFSFLFKSDTRAEAYRSEIANRSLYLSFMSVAEIKCWAIQRRWGPDRLARLDSTLRRYVVIPFDIALTDEWARITAQRASIGRPIGCGDCWIAATAVLHGLPLATNNAAHFSGIRGLTLITGNR